MTEWTDIKNYEIKQIDDDGELLSSVTVDAASGEAAARQIEQVAAGTDKILVCLDGDPMTEMEVDYWAKRVRGRR